MIQATDAAQILYGGHYSRKKTQATQNFNIAAIFHDGRKGWEICWLAVFAVAFTYPDHLTDHVESVALNRVKIGVD